ncbi:MAG: response regulator [Defluviitaleaceae bacterium]|nr:response regulator [Defluviitaleaceae bacterium]
MSKIIFVVDDNDINLTMAKEALKDEYRVMTLPSAAKMFAMMEKMTPDLILLDIEMPEMDGFEALQLLKANENTARIPIIFLTSMTDTAIEVKGFEMGVVDFVGKPFSEPVLRNRIKSHLDIDGLIRERTAQLQEKTIELQRIQTGVVSVLADTVANRDYVTGGHIQRTSIYLSILLEELLARDLHKEIIESTNMDMLILSARLHDVGKITISDFVLNKEGKLTDEEFVIMKSHSAEGARIIEQMIERVGDVEFLQNAKIFAGAHHERWDGRGYPNGTAGEATHVFARAMAVVDVYDALVSVRPYKTGMTSEQAVAMIVENAGTQFDPVMAKVLEESQERFKAVSR